MNKAALKTNINGLPLNRIRHIGKRLCTAYPRHRPHSGTRCSARVVIASMLFMVLALCVTDVAWANKTTRILLIQAKESAIYSDVRKSLSETLSNYGVNEYNLSLKILSNNSESKPVNNTELGQTDLIVTIGTKAGQQILPLDLPLPVLSILIPKDAYETITHNGNQKTVNNINHERSAIFLDQPLDRRFALIKTLLPDTKRVGVLLGPSSSKTLPQLKELAQQHGFKLQVEQLKQESNAIKAIQRMTSSSDTVLAIYDRLVLNPTTAKWLLYITYQHRVPVIGFSHAYVEAGALASVYSSFQQIGQQAAETILNAEKHAWHLGKPQYPQHFANAINHSVARSLHINIIDEVQLKKKLIELEKDVE